MKPFFTIITCTYNSEKVIGKNVNSVINQTYDNFEQVIIDGDSKDKTLKIIKDLTRDLKYKILIKKYPPKGISNAFNKGINDASGRYIYFLNSDDHFYDNRVLKDVSRFIEKNNFDWIYGKIRVIDDNGGSMGTFPERKIFQRTNYNLLKFFNYIPHQSVFMKKEVFEKFGGFKEDLKTNMDYELWLRVAKNTKWRFFDRIIANYMISPGAASSGRSNRKENVISLKKIQTQYLNIGEELIVKVINFLIDKYNKIYR